jgi:LPXTG-motif cell wall-anchored protein
MSLRAPLKLVSASLVAAATLFLGPVAGAVENPDYTAPAPTVVVADPANGSISVGAPRSNAVAAVPGAGAATSTAATATAARQRLAITGSDTAQLAVLGAVLVAVGAGALVLRRRSTALR